MVKSALVFGHVNVGKSTLLGHMLLLMDYINIHEFDKLSKMANINGKRQSSFAYILDSSEEEQKTGNTHEYVDICLKYKDEDYKFYDTPGHHCLITEFIQALYRKPSTAVLIVSAVMDELESSITSGVIQEYTVLARCVGIKNLVVCVNKMDKIAWGNFSSIEEKITQRILHIGYKPIFIPVSGFLGEGLTHRTKAYPNLPCLLELIKEDPKEDKQDPKEDKEDPKEDKEDPKEDKEDPKVDCKEDPNDRKTVNIRIKVFSPTLISAGWTGICHYANNNAKSFIVQKVYTLKGKEIPYVNNKDCLLTIEFDVCITIVKKSRVIIRNGDKTIAGGIVT